MRYINSLLLTYLLTHSQSNHIGAAIESKLSHSCNHCLRHQKGHRTLSDEKSQWPRLTDDDRGNRSAKRKAKSVVQKFYLGLFSSQLQECTTSKWFCLLISSQFRCCGRSEAEGRTEMAVIRWRCRGNRLPACWQTHSSARFRCEIRSRRGSSTVDPTLHHCRRSTSPGILLSTLVLYVVSGALSLLIEWLEERPACKESCTGLMLRVPEGSSFRDLQSDVWKKLAG